jgi:hypothetical protein
VSIIYTLLVADQPLDFCTTEILPGILPQDGAGAMAFLNELEAIGATHPFWSHRGKAIQGYAQLESALCHLLVALSGMTLSAAATVFYKIISTNARNAMLEKLLHQKCSTSYNPFWNGYIRELRTIDLQRNEIVHWLAAAYLCPGDGGPKLGIALIPPAMPWSTKPKNEPRVTVRELSAFEAKCEDFARMALDLSVAIKPMKGMKASRQSLRDKFQQPFLYPPPKDRP